MSMMFFYFLKIIFDISTSKRSKKYKSHSILEKKKNSNLDETRYKPNVLLFCHRYVSFSTLAMKKHLLLVSVCVYNTSGGLGKRKE
jgi:hypothetical protein